MVTPASRRERVVLVHINFPKGQITEDLSEFQALAISAGAEILAVVTGTRSAPATKYFIGTGKAEEIKSIVLATTVDLVIFNHVLSPAQERNLERLFKCRVLDRTGLILDIFAQRARSFEGKLQVELALLQHLSTRLIRGWTHLERQRGGIGLRGPGETQLEVDRRLIRHRIKIIIARLVKIRKQREQGRRARRRAIVPTVALVGYTNAGKSTLFNRLTGADVYVANQLFATLDPTMRRIDFPEIGSVILADTVGFIANLPHDLIEAFQATLEEVASADLLLHVIDAQDPNKKQHISEVEQVLASIGADTVPTLLVYNKADLLDADHVDVEYTDTQVIKRVSISALSGSGIPMLINSIAERLGRELCEAEVVLSLTQSKLRAQLYQRDAVLKEVIDESGCYHLQIRLPRQELEQLHIAQGLQKDA